MRQRDIFIFWLPLFASWLLMSGEGPIISAAINRLPDEVVMLAAQGIVLSLSVTIESPIINLLSTSTALVRDYASFRVVRRFTIHWSIFLTIVSALVAFTPLFDVIVFDWLSTPREIGVWVRPGMQIMVFWSAAIAWRRFLQGAMIHFGHTRPIGWGTGVRLLASGGTAIGLALLTAWPGVVIGASALMAGVIAEALYATVAIQPVLRNELHPEAVPAGEQGPLRYRELFWFHLPLATTAVLMLLAQPLVNWSLARSDSPTVSLAAWPMIFQLLLMARAAATALPETVIALSRGPETVAPLRRFSLILTGATVLVMLALVFTPLLPFYLGYVQDADIAVAGLAASGTRIFLLYPALFVVVSWQRGLLIKGRATRPVNTGMAINLVVTGLFLVLGVAMRWPGIPAAALALYAAIVAEFLYLAWRVRAELGISLLPGLSTRRLRPAPLKE